MILERRQNTDVSKNAKNSPMPCCLKSVFGQFPLLLLRRQLHFKSLMMMQDNVSLDCWNKIWPLRLSVTKRFLITQKKTATFLHSSFYRITKRDVALDDELKSRVIAAQYTLNELGPAWQNEVSNSHFSMPENILLMY